MTKNEDIYPTSKIGMSRRVVTHAERLLLCAGWEIDCPEAHAGVRSTKCKSCGRWHSDEPGKVPRFPTLRGDCSDTGQICPVNLGTSRSCPKCRGRGFVLVDDIGATLPCAHEWHFGKQDNGNIVATCWLTRDSQSTLERGPTHNEAAIAALYAEAQKERKP